jgi:cytochrome bd-type quinol oxidase subunit 2
MRKLLSITALSLLALPAKFASAANLREAFNQGGFVDRVAGPDGAGYNLSNRSIDPIIGQLILFFTSLLGVIFLLLTIYGGITWMLSRGEEKKIKSAQDTIQAAVIGLIIVVAAYMITYFILVRIAAPAISL